MTTLLPQGATERDGKVYNYAGLTILGVFLLFCGAAAMKIAFYLLDAPQNPVGLRLGGWGIGGAAGLLIALGVILLLTGNWLPSALP